MESDLYSQFVRPYAGTQLQMLKLDIEFQSAKGDWIKAIYKDETWEVLDLLGGFGANLLGHNHPEILKVVEEFLAQSGVQLAQLSLRKAAALLAQRLSVLCNPVLGEGSIVHLSSTGSEAVEVALKNALLNYQCKVSNWQSSWNGIQEQLQAGIIKPCSTETLFADPENLDIKKLLSGYTAELEAIAIAKMQHSYHGRTLASISASDSPLAKYLPKNLSGHKTIMLKNSDSDAILDLENHQIVRLPVPEIKDRVLTIQWQEFSRLAAILVEPVQGEGGIHILSRATTRALNELAQNTGALLIADEVQCGLGRTGEFFASASLGLEPGAVLFGKSLGGGIAKVGASAFASKHYNKILGRFGSTFAEDELSCRVALRSLEILQVEQGPERARAVGEVLHKVLTDLKNEFPDTIKECRGTGLMYGVEFESFAANPSCMLRLFQSNALSAFLMASFLLHRHHLRVAPSLSHPNTLRIEPSIFYDTKNNQKLREAFADLATAIERGDFAYLTQHLRESGDFLAKPRDFRKHDRKPQFSRVPCDAKVAFVGHLMDMSHLPLFDASLAGIDLKSLISWYRKGEGFFGPALFDRVCIKGKSGKTVELSMIGIYETPATFAAAIRTRNKALLLGRVQEAVDMAAAHGCEVIGLGGLTSIVASNGTTIDSHGAALTTGNSLTAAMTVAAIEKAARIKGLDFKTARIAIVGAAGNIGMAYTRWALTRFNDLRLFGSVDSWKKNSSFVDWARGCSQNKITFCTELKELKDCDIIVTMTNQAVPVIYPEHLSAKVKVILDVAVPSDVHASVREVFKDLLVIEGGWVKVPGLQTHLIGGMDTPAGHTLACLAETAVLGLSGRRQHYSYGDIQEQKIREIYQLALAEGFELGEFRFAKAPAPADPKFRPARESHLSESSLQI